MLALPLCSHTEGFPAMPSHSSSAAVPRIPIAVPRTRRWIQTLLADWNVHLDDCARDSIAVITSELVANAVQHGTGATLTVGLRINPNRQRLLIEVHDDSTDLPSARTASLEAESGRGMLLVQRLALNHGCERTDHGKKVWAELGIPAQPLTRRQFLRSPRRMARSITRRLSGGRRARILRPPGNTPHQDHVFARHPTASCP
ncbi:ATP-binding protein [Kitasatospora purpeofusca]|uniref:ATP-binding protein n=1 Tax=Kitasatospora purpeofusca TaxID=67352 RepID=UPI0033F5DE64